MTGPRPNIVLVMADDLGVTNLGCYGSEDLRTPHIDAIAEGGVRFTHAYSAAPVCSPARAGLLTGRHPLRTGAVNYRPTHDDSGFNLSETLLPERLAEVGYATGCIGKWHLGIGEPYRPTQRGFHEFYGVLNGMIDYFSHERIWGGERRGKLFFRNQQQVDSERGYFTELVTREACDFIRRHAAEPFFLYLPYTAPHGPMQVPERYLDRCSHIADESRGRFAAMVTCLDDGIGQIRQTLRDLDLAGNTLVVFTCDHGWDYRQAHLPYASNQPLRLGKYWLYEGGIRVPALVELPGRIPAGRVNSEPVSGLDWFPTLLRYAGVPLPTDRVLDGQDLIAVIERSAPSPHDALFWAYDDEVVSDIPAGHAAVRRGEWKLVRAARGDELYHLDSDPREARDLAVDRPDLHSELSATLDAWLEQTRR
jgi:arylsulfatase A-like enzyme